MTMRRAPAQLSRARRMRRAPTKAEEILWRDLRDNALGVKFRRQVPVGTFVADFACLPAKLIVELDGPPHEREAQRLHDARRDAWLSAHGWRILRFPNDLVFGGGDIVLERIRAALHRVPSSGTASPRHLLPRAGEGLGGNVSPACDRGPLVIARDPRLEEIV